MEGQENQLVLLEGQTRPKQSIPEGFYKGQPRPNYSSPEVLVMVVDRLLPQVMQWGKFRVDEAPEIAEQVMKALKNGTDGYHRAKYLEDRFSWDSDSELVEVMESDDFYGAARDAIKAWIRDNAIVPAFEAGRQVSVKVRRLSEMVTGTIRSLTEDGMYCIMVPALGHVESGLGTHGLLFPWEDVEAWNSVEQA